MMSSIIRVGLAMVLAASCATAAQPAQKPAVKVPFPQIVRTGVAEKLSALQEDGDYSKAQRDLLAIFDQVIACGLAKDLDAFREAAFAVRLVEQLQAVPEGKRQDLLKYLRANDNLARTLVFLIRPKDKPADVYAMLEKLREKYSAQLDRFATLTAAICVVHDRPLQRRVNENKADAPDPVALFAFYAGNENRMLFGLRNVPAELLIYVVDATASIDELNWALQNYAGNAAIGKTFFDIKYDFDHLRTGRTKRVTSDGFNLPNILAWGGVCADQAHFATTAGKAIGVPTAYTVGASGDNSHAWVGFLQAGRRGAGWNFDTGRYEAYKGVRGIVLDPQLREPIPDSFVSLLAEMIGSTAAGRQAGTALADAAIRLIELDEKGEMFSPPAMPENAAGYITANPRVATAADQLALLELAIRQSPGDRYCWLPVRHLGKSGKLTLEQKKYWANVLIAVSGGKYPDFAHAFLTPMVETVEKIDEQDRLWDKLFQMFQASRPDLAAAVCISRAEMWEKQNDNQKAGLCYYMIIERYPNAGPFVLDALRKAEGALRATDRADRVPMLYEGAWQRLNRPREMAGPFMTQSNWHRVGTLLAAKLDEAGQRDRAALVRAQLGGTAAAEQ